MNQVTSDTIITYGAIIPFIYTTLFYLQAKRTEFNSLFKKLVLIKLKTEFKWLFKWLIIKYLNTQLNKL